jgi:hypothetical protein
MFERLLEIHPSRQSDIVVLQIILVVDCLKFVIVASEHTPELLSLQKLTIAEIFVTQVCVLKPSRVDEMQPFMHSFEEVLHVKSELESLNLELLVLLSHNPSADLQLLTNAV